MNIKAAYKWQLSASKIPVIVYYAVIFGLILTMFFSLSITASNDTVAARDFTGINVSSAIFIFVFGLCSFKENYFMLSQNGISRKTQYISQILTFMSVAIIMDLLDKIILFATKTIAFSIGDNIKFNSLYELIYTNRTGFVNIYLEAFLFDLCTYLCIVSLGYLITILFYRLNKLGKVAVGAGVPVFLTFVLPLLDAGIFNNRISDLVKSFFYYAFGIDTMNPYIPMLSLFILTLLFNVFAWLLIRRATIKK